MSNEECEIHENPDHQHGEHGDHTKILHGDHSDYIVNRRLHHPHGDHCDDHGPIETVENQ
ncbi:MAG: hypothetical protein JAY74_25565 [Candidatus Thiodiazotropha taylori]|nr:hypothetical protein [Candidatus Thiodiazotropha taylori]